MKRAWVDFCPKCEATKDHFRLWPPDDPLNPRGLVSCGKCGETVNKELVNKITADGSK